MTKWKKIGDLTLSLLALAGGALLAAGTLGTGPVGEIVGAVLVGLSGLGYTAARTRAKLRGLADAGHPWLRSTETWIATAVTVIEALMSIGIVGSGDGDVHRVMAGILAVLMALTYGQGRRMVSNEVLSRAAGGRKR